jgi:CRISPR system Cascade subunit CasE
MYMLQMTARTGALLTWARQAGVPSRDLGYLAHNAMRAAFGQAAPQPFTMLEEPSGRLLTLLGYGPSSKQELLVSRAYLAEPMLAEAFPAQGLADKPMPTAWPQGVSFGFRVRCCPVARRHEADGSKAERDVFLSACLSRPGEPVDRQEEYLKWLVKELGRQKAAELVSGHLRSFNLRRLVRRAGRGRPAAQMRGQRPDVEMEGVLRVATPQAFADLMQRGVGRHRAFGFGMLLLRAAR